MHIALIGTEHPYLRRMKRALCAAGHVVDTEPVPQAEHILVDARALIEMTADLQRLTALVYHPDARAQEHLRRLRRVIAASYPVAERLIEEFGVERARVAVVTPGVDPGPRVPGNTSGCRILSVGALIPRKGHDVLLRALGRLFDLDWQLTVVGRADRDPAYAHALMEQAAEPGLAGRVRFIDTGDEDEALERLWQESDLFALATHWEGYGMAIGDALYRGLPVAVTAGGEAGKLVTPLAGVICPPGDHEGLSKALRRLIFDRKLRREMSDAAFAEGQTLPDWRTQAEALVAALT